MNIIIKDSKGGRVKGADVCGSAENSVSAKSSSQVKERRQVEWIGMQESEPVSASALDQVQSHSTSGVRHQCVHGAQRDMYFENNCGILLFSYLECFFQDNRCFDYCLVF
jgi:hypothetical protein